MIGPRQILPLAALLHDVGDFVAFASSHRGAAMDHGELGSNWLHTFVELGLPERVAELAKARRGADLDSIARDEVSQAIYHADHLLVQPGPDAKTDAATPPWRQSIFSVGSDKPVGFQAGTTAALPYPEAETPIPDFASVVAAFGEAFRRWVQAGCSPHALLRLIELYWGHMPATARGDDTLAAVSMLDTARLKCALACGLHAAAGDDLLLDALPTDKPYFRLVVGKLCGAEAGLEQWAGRAEVATLLGRAFLARLLMEHAADDLLAGAGLSDAHALHRSDSEFVLLCPNDPRLDDAAARLCAAVNEWLLDRFGLAMHLVAASVPMTPANLRGEGLAQAFAAAEQQLDALAHRPFADRLTPLTTPWEPANPDAACEVCGSESDPELDLLSSRAPDVKACRQCRGLSGLGAGLHTAIGLSAQACASDSRDALCLPKHDGSWTQYALAAGDSAPGAAQLRYAFADAHHAADSAERVLAAGRHIRSSAHLPKTGRTGDKKRRHEIASLRALAKSSRGAARLGLLRFDVDAARSWVWESQPTLVRFAAASRALARFFEEYVPALCAARMPRDWRALDLGDKRYVKGVGRNVTLVRSAGDDLLLLGAWDEVAEAAIDIADAFGLYTSGSGLAASAAVVVDSCDAALCAMAQAASEGVALAKAAGGDRLALFFDRAALVRGQAPGRRASGRHTWQGARDAIVRPLRELLGLGRIVQNHFEPHLAPGFVARLLALLDQWEQGAEWPVARMAHLTQALRDGGRADLAAVQQLLMDTSKWPGLKPALTWLDRLSDKP